MVSPLVTACLRFFWPKRLYIAMYCSALNRGHALRNLTPWRELTAGQYAPLRWLQQCHVHQLHRCVCAKAKRIALLRSPLMPPRTVVAHVHAVAVGAKSHQCAWQDRLTALQPSRLGCSELLCSVGTRRQALRYHTLPNPADHIHVDNDKCIGNKAVVHAAAQRKTACLHMHTNSCVVAN